MGKVTGTLYNPVFQDLGAVVTGGTGEVGIHPLGFLWWRTGRSGVLLLCPVNCAENRRRKYR